MKTKSLCALLVVAVIVSISCVYAFYVITSQHSPDVVVGDKATLSAPTVSSIAINVGDNLTLTTTLSDGLSGVNVTFFNQNDVVVGTAVTDSAGVATLTIQPPLGTWSFYAQAEHP